MKYAWRGLESNFCSGIFLVGEGESLGSIEVREKAPLYFFQKECCIVLKLDYNATIVNMD